MAEKLTKDQFIKALPSTHYRGQVSDEVINNINSLLDEPILRENFRDNLVGYSSILANGRYNLDRYVDAVKFVSYKLLGSTAVEAYSKTFPDRYAKLLNENADNSTIASYAAAYNKTVLVNKIYEQTLVPTHVLNADIFQKAINVQAHLMMTANSEKVRSDAANSLLTHLKRPEAQKIELDVSVKEDKSIDELRQTTMDLVAAQKKMIESGMSSTKEIAHSRIIQGEVVEE